MTVESPQGRSDRNRIDRDNLTRGLSPAEWVEAVFQRAAPPEGFRLDPKRFTDLDKWSARLHAQLEDLLHVERPRRPPEVVVLGQKACNGYMRRDVRIRVTPRWQIPAWLLIPTTGRPPYPAIVALHDWGGFMYYGRAKLVEIEDEPAALTAFKQACYGGRSVASELARRGYVVLVTDAMCFGDRRLGNQQTEEIEMRGLDLAQTVELLNPLLKQTREGSWRAVAVAGATWPGLLFDDDRVALRWLAGLEEVDARRIGCVGLSVGAWRAVHLAALEPGIAAAVAVGWMSALPDIVRSQTHGSGALGTAHLIAGLTRYADYPHVAALAAPRPLLSIQGRQDGMFPPEGVQRAWEIIADVYARRQAADRFRGAWYDAPHCFNLAMQKEAFDWLDRWLARPRQ